MSSAYASKNSAMLKNPDFTSGITNGVAWYPLYGGMQDVRLTNDYLTRLSGITYGKAAWKRQSRFPAKSGPIMMKCRSFGRITENLFSITGDNYFQVWQFDIASHNRRSPRANYRQARKWYRSFSCCSFSKFYRTLYLVLSNFGDLYPRKLLSPTVVRERVLHYNRFRSWVFTCIG